MINEIHYFILNYWKMITALALAGAFFNCFFRGGLVETVYLTPCKDTAFVQKLIKWKLCTVSDSGYVSLRLGKPINFIAYGVTSWLLSGSPLAGFSSSAGMATGEAPGWGDYIRAMRGMTPDRSVAWGIRMMVLRCGFWGLCLAAGPFIVSFWVDLPHIHLFAALCVFTGLLNGLGYYLAIWAWYRFGWPQNKVLNDWTAAEMVGGVLMWPCLAILACYCRLIAILCLGLI